MPSLTGFERPTLEALIQRRRADTRSRIPGADLTLAQGVLPRLPEIIAEGDHAHHAHLDWGSRQAHPLYAEGDWLEAWARTWGVVRTPASRASGTVTLTAEAGSVVPQDAELKRGDGVLYRATTTTAEAGGTIALPVEAVAASKAGNADEGAKLSLTSPVAGVTLQGVVAPPGLTGGADAEPDGRIGVAEHLRGRMLRRIRRPPNGGTALDLVDWALEVPGVTRAWTYPRAMGIGTATLRFMMDDTYADGIPQGDFVDGVYSGDLKTVHDYLESHADPVTGETVGRVITLEVFVVAPVALPIDVTVEGLTPATPEVEAEAEAEIADAFRRRAEPGKADASVVFSKSWIHEAVSIAAGESRHRVTVPADDVVPGVGEIPVLNSVTYA